jgi:adenine-specific DNA-methyltransferase
MEEANMSQSEKKTGTGQPEQKTNATPSQEKAASSLEKFQDLIRQLFQIEAADLDFGIYRILNYKREQVEDFINKRLPQIVNEEFQDYAKAERETLQREIERKREEISQAFGEKAFDQQGQLQPDFRETPLGKKYLALQEEMAQYQVTKDLEISVYNDLYTFFSRYYEDGDFIAKRRYGRRETYAIPYNGEEVVLHWATKDQYYIKTGERFKNYRFKVKISTKDEALPKVQEYTTAFELRSATTEQNNNKGDKRYFVLASDNPVALDPEAKTIIVFFEYRPLTEAEQKEFGRTKQQQKLQDNLNEKAADAILKRLQELGLNDLKPSEDLKKDPQDPKAQSKKSEAANGKSLLMKHLTRFTRRNTSDFFIHKNLRRFLQEELEFFIKSQCLLLEELLAQEGNLTHQHILRARVVRKIGYKIIDFLAQVEDFQKRLFEKKKFVIKTHFCLTLDRIFAIEDDETRSWLLEQIIENNAQWDEWVQLFAIDKLEDSPLPKGKREMAFLKAHPYLVIDTRHFSEDFKWRLLGCFDDLDEALDGLLIKSENFQALNLLLERYRGQVKCIYIDPPYNTGNDEFIYKDSYQHSSWLTMLLDRLTLAQAWLSSHGLLWQSVDDNEEPRARLIGELSFGPLNHVANVIWQKKYTRANDARWFSDNHDYILVFANNKEEARLVLLPRTGEQEAAYQNPDKDPRGPWKATPLHAKSGSGSGFSYTFKNGVTWSPPPGTFPRYSPETLARLDENNELWFGPDGKSTPARKSFLSNVKQGVVPLTIWPYDEVGHNHEAINELKALFPENPFSNPKPTRLIRQVVFLSGGDVVLDFFAGSGTTAHAVINLNREDDGRRKYILVEMGDYFETVLLPRIKKVVYSDNWKDGKPQKGKGISHFFKYLYLEQYEDTLNNLELTRKEEGQLALERFGDEYLLRYMLKFETQGSPSLLNLKEFQDPFNYKLKVQEGDEIRERVVDLVETLNYLLGIHVKKMRQFQDNGRLYRAVLGEKRGKRIVIVWRPLNGLNGDTKALQQDRQFIQCTVIPALLGEGKKPDRLLVNGNCYVPGAESIELEFTSD